MSQTITATIYRLKGWGSWLARPRPVRCTSTSPIGSNHLGIGGASCTLARCFLSANVSRGIGQASTLLEAPQDLGASSCYARPDGGTEKDWIHFLR